MTRSICPNCARPFRAQTVDAECPRCHQRTGAGSHIGSVVPGRVFASTYSVAPPLAHPTPPPSGVQAAGTNGIAVASLVLGIIGLVLWPLALVALPMGIVGKARTRRLGQPGGELAVAGIALGFVAIAIAALEVTLFFVALVL